MKLQEHPKWLDGAILVKLKFLDVFGGLDMAARVYTARLVTNSGRPGLLVEFRHPGVLDRQGYGRKVTRGLKTRDKPEADTILTDLNQILADASLHEFSARNLAAAQFHPKAVEAFYGVYTREDAGVARREQLIPLERPECGVPTIGLVGNTSVGKTSLLRRILGTVNERFPAISGNRTTLFPCEFLVEDGQFRAAISFRSETETELALQQMGLKAVMRALDGADDELVIRELFEPIEDGLRLKYLLGIPKLSGDAPVDQLARRWVERARLIASAASREITSEIREGSEKVPENAGAVRERIEDEAEGSDGLAELVSEIVEELRERSEVQVPGQIARTATGWPISWKFDASSIERERFIKEVKRFTGNQREDFGILLTPLVNGARIAGPFFSGTNSRRPLVLNDTVGFGHYADTASDLNEAYAELCDRVDCILVVESAKTSFSSNSLHQVLEATVTTGHVSKLAVAFTHMDALDGDDVSDETEAREKALVGLRSAVDQHVAKKLSRDAARQLSNHLAGENVFYFGSLNIADDTTSNSELERLRKHFSAKKAATPFVTALPEYEFKFFVPFVIAAIDNFRNRWSSLLGVRSNSVFDPLPWQSVKAVARRNADTSINDDYPYRPVASLNTALRQEIAKFLDSPLNWQGQAPSDEEKQTIIDVIKAELSLPLLRLCTRTLRTVPRPQWITAWEFRGPNSTIRRRSTIEGLFGQHLPYFRLDNAIAVSFINEVESLVQAAIHSASEKLKNDAQNQSKSVCAA